MIEPYYERDGITLYCGNCEEVMPQLDTDSINLVLTDPPYFRVKGDWWDRQWNTREGFLSWMGDRADEWRRVMKPNGSLYCFASPELSWHVEGVIRERFNVLSSIVWAKPDPSSEINQGAGRGGQASKEALRSWFPSRESIIFAEQQHDEYATMEDALHREVFRPIGDYFRLDRERAGMNRNDVEVSLGFVSSSDPSRGTALCYRWEEGSSLPTNDTYLRLRGVLNAAGGEYLRKEYDELRKEYDELRKEYERQRLQFEQRRRPFTLTANGVYTDVWTYKTVSARYGKHPCEKPRAMMEHIIKASSRPNDLVLDCFAGTGATLDAARLMGRRAIGIEISEKYCEAIVNRLSQVALPLGI